MTHAPHPSVTGSLPPAGEYLLDPQADVWADWSKTAGLIRQLTRRHLAARYRGSALGFFWSLLNPLLLMLVYTFVFQFVLRMETPGVPYPAFFLTGLLAWSFFSTAARNAATSVIDGAPLIHKAYFPRIALPLGAVLSNAVNYLVALPLLLLFNLAFGVAPGRSLLWLPAAVLLLTLLAVGIGLIAASLTPFFRDLLQLLEVGFAAWFFATPVLYPETLAAENLAGGWWLVYELNPMVGITVLIRAAFLQQPLRLDAVAISAVGCLVLLALGAWIFHRLAPSFTEAC